MSYQRRALILNLALVVFGMGATVGCRAEGVTPPRTVSGLHNASLLLCTAVFSHCDPAALTSQTTTHNTGRQSSIKVRHNLRLARMLSGKYRIAPCPAGM